MVEPHVIVERLSKQFPGHLALNDCSLQISRGEVFGLLGPNGAGKSTLLRLLLGFIRPSSGSAHIGGLDCFSQRVAVHEQLSYLPGDARLFRTMKGTHVLRFFSSMRAGTEFERAREIAERLELDLSRWVAFMSTGMRQKLALAAVLAARVPLTILDEPTANLDPSVRSTILKIIEEIREEGGTVIFSSHVLGEVEEVCDRVGILRAGKLVCLQSLADVRRRYLIHGRFINQRPDQSEIPGEVSHFDPVSGRFTFVVDGDVHGILVWLAGQLIEELEIESVGLRAVYDRYHSDSVLGEKAGSS